MPPKDEKTLAEVLAEVNKKYGATTLTRASESRIASHIQRFPTGIFLLDYGMGGGIPVGRFTMLKGYEGTGKSTIAMMAARSAQKTCRFCYAQEHVQLDGEICWPHTEDCPTQEKGRNDPDGPGCRVAYIDVEGTFYSPWAHSLGVDLDKLYLSQPEYAEQAVDIIQAMLYEGVIDLVILDSVASMAPSEELEKSAEDNVVGTGGKLMNRAFRSWSAAMNKTGNEYGRKPTVIFINQMRLKVGVMFGCFEHGAMVSLADGTRKKIGEIVNGRLPVEVLSVEDGKVVPRKVVGWHNNGPTETWLKVKVSRCGTVSQFKCTPNHQIATPGGFVSAGDLVEGDVVLSRYKKTLSKVGERLVLGMALGDGNLRFSNDSPTSPAAHLRMEHSHGQSAYCEWKGLMFKGILNKSERTKRNNWLVETKALTEVKLIRDLLYVAGKKVFSDAIAEMLTPLEVALWYMDDGTLSKRKKWGGDRSQLCIAGWDTESRERIRMFFIDRGMECALYGGNLVFSVEGTLWFQEAICKFIPSCMQYKLSEGFQDKGALVSIIDPEELYESGDALVSRTVIGVEEVTTKSSGGLRKPSSRYDITVEGGHSYFVSDVLVHNSPETTPGGKGQLFAPSVVVMLRPSSPTLGKGTTPKPLRWNTKFKVEKNKTGVAHLKGEYALAVTAHAEYVQGDVVDFDSVLAYAKETGVVTQDKKKWVYTPNGLPDVQYRVQDDMLTAWKSDFPLYQLVKRVTLRRALDALA